MSTHACYYRVFYEYNVGNYNQPCLYQYIFRYRNDISILDILLKVSGIKKSLN